MRRRRSPTGSALTRRAASIAQSTRLLLSSDLVAYCFSLVPSSNAMRYGASQYAMRGGVAPLYAMFCPPSFDFTPIQSKLGVLWRNYSERARERYAHILTNCETERVPRCF
jgi:hypothetical protein